MSTKVIIQGDDWGHSEEVNNGIADAYSYGILTETNIMANLLDLARKAEYQAFFQNLENKSGLKKSPLSFGVHLNLTQGPAITSSWPITNMSRPYNDTGKPEEWIGSAWAKYFAQLDPVLIEQEFRAQIDKALTIFGTVDHLDSHQNIHSYEPVKTVFLKLAKEYKLGVRVVAPLSETPVYGGDFLVDGNFPTEAKQLGIKTPGHTILTLFWNETDPLESFLDAVNNLPDNQVTEFMFHPAKGASAQEWRQKDLELLTNEKTIQLFNDNNIELINYRQL